MASSAAAAAYEDPKPWVCAKPTDGGVYTLKEGAWYCCMCRTFAPESHLVSKNHCYWLHEHLTGKYSPLESIEDVARPGIAPPPPPGQPTDDRPGPPPAYPPRGQAAMSEENVMLRDAKLAIILANLHDKFDMILTKVGAMEARFDKLDMILTRVGAMETRLDKLECKIDAWSNWE